MRFLQRRADGKFSLTEVSQNIPSYAILSHTWEEGEEVTFEDVTQIRGLEKKGYQKLEFCARQAADDGIPYFWVDSCCINKSDASELSEAINSMFRWYQQSAKCYVYLTDVSKGTDIETDEPSRSTWKVSFRQSRWFTRGWTLQELIAPASVEFFSREGQRLGDKRSLEQSLVEITKIPEPALRGTPLSQFNIKERTSWAKGRTTTRTEDIAYSLFGIFGVFLPPIYGEGAQRALSRLRKEISGVQEPLPKVLAELPIVHGAAFDSHAEEHNPTCLRDTRVDLLREIDEWIQFPNAEAIFWLNGMAGTGKSTISRTLAQTASVGGFLGASFFFKRGEGDRGGVSKFFSTLAAQLCSQEPAVTSHIQAAIDSDPAIFGKAMREQFEKLVLQPLSKLSGAAYQDRTLLIIVDALDECEHEEDIRLLIYLFSSSKRMQSPRLKIFLTSRPELSIRLGFTAIKGAYQDLILHEVAEPIIERDIRAFLESKLTRIRKEYNASVPDNRHVPATWPREADIQTLVKMAVPLFIFAATVCRFIGDRKGGNPDKKLRKVLEQRTKSQESKFDATYMPVLEQLLIGQTTRERDETLGHFRTLVGSIVVLASPLSTSALARLLHTTMDDILNNLDLFYSVLSIPSSSEQPIRLLHLSFRDFLLDPEKRENNPFWIDEKAVHRRLATECIRVMNGSLRTDICQVQAPGTTLSEIDPERIEKHLGPEMQYACRYWVYHLEHSGTQLSDGDEVLNFLTRHFLHWLEALSLINRVSESLEILATIRGLTSSPAKQLDAFLDDANRFILANVSAIQVAPLQIYSSGLLFAPKQSVIRTTFEHDLPKWIKRGPEVDDKWSNCRQTLEGHTDSVSSVVFSHDSKLVASASADKTVKLWDAKSGKELQTLEGHSSSVSSVAFSHDSKLVASASDDKTVKLWDAKTAEVLQTLEGHSRWVRSVAFSHNSKLVASASADKTVKLWDAKTAEVLQTLEGHSNSVSSVVFSHNSKLVASASYDGTVKLWDSKTGQVLQTLEGHSSSVSSVAFSHDSKLVASASAETVKLWEVKTGQVSQPLEGRSSSFSSVEFLHDGKLVASASAGKTVKLWDAKTGQVLQPLEGHNIWVNSVAFSHDSKLIASASYDKTVKLWDATIVQVLQTLEGHSDPVSLVAISHNSKLVASASTDKTVKLWDVKSGKVLQTLEGHNIWVRSVAFSHNSKLVASASDDKTVKLWDAKSGKELQTLEGHSSSVSSVAFSHDSKLVASASADKTVKLWDAKTGKELQTLEGHNDSVRSVAFSHDSKLVASASDDKTVKLWDAKTAEVLQTIYTGATSFTLSFSPDSSSILTDGRAISICSQPNQSLSPQRDVARLGYSISKDCRWITWYGNHLLWLPPQLRPIYGGFAASGSLVTIGCASGRVLFIQCDVEGVGKL